MGAIAAIKPGVPYRDVHLGAAKSFVTDLTALGLMKGNADEAVAAGAHALFFPHGLGHMMGMDVHDMENLGEDIVGYGPGYERSTQFGLNYLRLARPLEPGFVLTVEPGLYFIPALIDQWKAEEDERRVHQLHGGREVPRRARLPDRRRRAGDRRRAAACSARRFRRRSRTSRRRAGELY